MEENINKFIKETGVSREIAKQYLEKNKGDLIDSIKSYYEFTKKSKPSGSGGFATLKDYQEEKKKPNDKNSYYAGSGQQIIGDPQNKDPDDLVSRIFETARENQKPKEEETKNEKKFSGSSGQKLGSTPTVITTETANKLKQQQTDLKKKKIEEEKELEVAITFYKQGFVVGTDPLTLRLYDDPESKSFLGSINKGYAPQELSQGEPVNLQIIDKKLEEWKPPPKVFKPYEGAGRSLGTSTQTIQSNVPGNLDTKNLVYKFDDSKPFTTIQIRLVDGKKLEIKCNLTDTVGQIFNFVSLHTPNVKFYLMTNFPKKKLDDLEKTVEEANLKNAVILQTLE